MIYVQAIILGLVQGLTEFLPISSSGHLVILQHFLRWSGPKLEFDVAVHFGTFVAIVIIFRREIKGILHEPLGPKTRLVLVATLPTALVGIIVHLWAKKIFESATLAASMLLLTGCYLWTSRGRTTAPKTPWNTTYLDALLVGIAQAFAIIPGLSRSGLTIVTSLHLGLERPWAGEFSFLIALPALAGATLLELRDIVWEGGAAVILGAVSSFLSGYLALKFLLGMIQRGKLHLFAPYCWAAGGAYLLYIYHWR